MKKKLFKILQLILCLPIIPIIGIPAGTGGIVTPEGTGDEKGKDDPETDPEPEGGEPEGDEKKDKTFTQAEVNAMMKREKASGRKSILAALGFKDEKSAKDTMTKFNEYLESQKTEAEKNAEKIKAAEEAKTEAEKKAELVEMKLTALQLGIKPDAVDDAMALASTKVTDEKDLSAVITEMKEKYPMFFTDGADNKGGGTGNPLGGKKGNFKTTGLGERLANSFKASSEKKSSYFNK